MLTSKQRAALRKLANNIDPIFQVGKGGVTPELVQNRCVKVFPTLLRQESL